MKKLTAIFIAGVLVLTAGCATTRPPSQHPEPFIAVGQPNASAGAPIQRLLKEGVAAERAQDLSLASAKYADAAFEVDRRFPQAPYETRALIHLSALVIAFRAGDSRAFTKECNRFPTEPLHLGEDETLQETGEALLALCLERTDALHVRQRRRQIPRTISKKVDLILHPDH